MPLWMWVLAAAAALPLLACLGLRLAGRAPEPQVWLIVAALAISLVMDVALWALAAPGANNAWVGYLGYPMQFAILMLAVAVDAPARWIGFGAVVLFGLASSAVPVSFIAAGRSLAVPTETITRVVGGLGVAALLLENPHLAWLRGPVLLYALGCVPFVGLMAALSRTAPEWVVVWAGYQFVRITSLGWLTVALMRDHFPAASFALHERQQVRPSGGGLP